MQKIAFIFALLAVTTLTSYSLDSKVKRVIEKISELQGPLSSEALQSFVDGLAARKKATAGQVSEICQAKSFVSSSAIFCLEKVLGGKKQQDSRFDVKQLRSALSQAFALTPSQMQAFANGRAARHNTSPADVSQCGSKPFNAFNAAQCIHQLYGENAADVGKAVVQIVGFNSGELQTFVAGYASSRQRRIVSHPDQCKGDHFNAVQIADCLGALFGTKTSNPRRHNSGVDVKQIRSSLNKAFGLNSDAMQAFANGRAVRKHTTPVDVSQCGYDFYNAHDAAECIGTLYGGDASDVENALSYTLGFNSGDLQTFVVGYASSRGLKIVSYPDQCKGNHFNADQVADCLGALFRK